MDNVLRNDIALIFQVVSEKEKKTNKVLKEKTKELVDIFLKLKSLTENKRKKNNEQ